MPLGRHALRQTCRQLARLASIRLWLGADESAPSLGHSLLFWITWAAIQQRTTLVRLRDLDRSVPQSQSRRSHVVRHFAGTGNRWHVDVGAWLASPSTVRNQAVKSIKKHAIELNLIVN